MAVYTKHPVGALPAAPPRETTGHLMVRAYSVLSLFCIFGHTAVYNLVGPIGSGIVMIVLTAGALAIWIPAVVAQRPTRFPWRRLPWTALGYAALALVSTLWSRWPAATLLTWTLLAAVTVTALLVATMLTWQEIARALSTVLKLILGLSLAVELWVALLLRHPLLPNFVDLPEGKIDPHLYWVRGNLFDEGRIQGVVGNAHTLAMMCLFALIVFGVLYATQVRRKTMLIFWAALAVVLLVKAGSATVYLSVAVVVAVLAAALIARAVSPGRRSVLYLAFTVVAVGGVVTAVLLRDRLLSLLGKGSDLTGRIEIWQAVWERAITRPVFGNGFSSPWVPWDPAFDGWIMNHGLSVFHAHDMWLDVFLQLGVVGLALMAIAWLALTWRAWFFAVDRPRWDLDAQRPYSPLSLLPVLLAAVLLVEGLAESAPIMLWGWLLLVLLSFKMKAVPLIGVGVRERTPVISHGPQSRQVP
ncbi:O-antigen ligase family protein [Microbacterium esteraromaticum]|uniref:O-antigen ligase family protein n=1 Tax=Microbacterium esteraromaticum TaxID=57043 RepID=A0A7D7WBS9_9MICO|nr:O-antigen ligase family protein [Microbacterium esteraromaticum]QMU97738.1 O-antigen ligase family protein [Microbacterium esteraromaticum]